MPLRQLPKALGVNREVISDTFLSGAECGSTLRVVETLSSARMPSQSQLAEAAGVESAIC